MRDKASNLVELFLAGTLIILCIIILSGIALRVVQ